MEVSPSKEKEAEKKLEKRKFSTYLPKKTINLSEFELLTPKKTRPPTLQDSQ